MIFNFIDLHVIDVIDHTARRPSHCDKSKPEEIHTSCFFTRFLLQLADCGCHMKQIAQRSLHCQSKPLDTRVLRDASAQIPRCLRPSGENSPFKTCLSWQRHACALCPIFRFSHFSQSWCCWMFLMIFVCAFAHLPTFLLFHQTTWTLRLTTSNLAKWKMLTMVSSGSRVHESRSSFRSHWTTVC